MAQVRFEDNRMEVMAALDDAAITYLYKACGELETQVKRNTRVDTGQIKNSWAYKVDESKGEGVIGALWRMQYGKNSGLVNMPLRVMVEKVVGTIGIKRPEDYVLPMEKHRTGLCIMPLPV